MRSTGRSREPLKPSSRKLSNWQRHKFVVRAETYGNTILSGEAADGTKSSRSWMTEWTVFYWGWWVAWAPFVGMFMAKISRGRTVRSIINGALTAPVLYGCATLFTVTSCTCESCGTSEPVTTTFSWVSIMAGDVTGQGPCLGAWCAVQVKG